MLWLRCGFSSLRVPVDGTDDIWMVRRYKRWGPMAWIPSDNTWKPFTNPGIRKHARQIMKDANPKAPRSGQ